MLYKGIDFPFFNDLLSWLRYLTFSDLDHDKAVPEDNKAVPQDALVIFLYDDFFRLLCLSYLSHFPFSVILFFFRYLESCNVPITVKRKCQSSSNTTSSNSDEDKQKAAERSMQVAEGRKTCSSNH